MKQKEAKVEWAQQALSNEDLIKTIKKTIEDSFILGQAALIVSPAQFEGLTKVLEEQEKFQKIKDTPLYKKLEGLE